MDDRNEIFSSIYPIIHSSSPYTKHMTPEQIKTSKLIGRIGIAEGVSFLVLLFICMPLKYLAGIPEAVKVMGWIHGVLFIAFMWAIFQGRTKLNWDFRFTATAFVASLIPFGTFWLEKKLKSRESFSI